MCNPDLLCLGAHPFQFIINLCCSLKKKKAQWEITINIYFSFTFYVGEYRVLNRSCSFSIAGHIDQLLFETFHSSGRKEELER